MCRTVTLILVDADGRAAGASPPFEVELPYWQEVADVVAGARRAYGVEVAVLRLLFAARPLPPGGAVTYLAQTDVVPAVLMRPVAMDSRTTTPGPTTPAPAVRRRACAGPRTL